MKGKSLTLVSILVALFILSNCDCGGGGSEQTDVTDIITDRNLPLTTIDFLDPKDGRNLTASDDMDTILPLIQYDVVVKVQNVEIGQIATLLNASDTTSSSSGKTYKGGVTKDNMGRYIATFKGVTFVNGANSITASVKNLSGVEVSKTIVVTAISEVSCRFEKPQNNETLTATDDKDQDISNGFQYNVQLSCIGVELNQNAKLIINGIEAATAKVGVNTLLFQDVTFAEGTNELDVNVSNLSGIKATVEKIKVTVNTGRCLIRIISPLDGSKYLVNGQGEKVILDKDPNAVGMQATIVAETAYEKTNTSCGIGSNVDFTITTPNKTFSVSGTVVEERGTKRLIAGVDITFDEEALLNGGVVSIVAKVKEAGDGGREGTSLPVRAIVDSVPPSGVISLPADGTLYNANMDADSSKPGFQIQVSGTTTGVSTYQKVMLRMDAAINPDLPPITMDMGSDTFTPEGAYQFKSVTIPEGIHTLRLFVIDDSGNEYETGDITITVDTGIPFAQFFWPANNSYLNKENDEDNAKPNLQTTKIDIRTQNIQNGQVGKLIVKGYLEYEFTVNNNKAVFADPVELPEGRLEMTIDVKNAGGLQAFVQPDPLIVTVDITPPVLAITEPSDNTNVDTNLIDVVVKTNGLENGEKVYLKVNDVDMPPAEVDDGWATFTDVPLIADKAKQPNAIKAYAMDKAGNKSNEPSINVYVDTTVPALTFEAPIEGATLTGADDKDSDIQNGLQYDVKVKAENLSAGTIGKLYIKQGGNMGSPINSLPATDIGGGFVEMVFENVELPEGDITLRAEAQNLVGKIGFAEVNITVNTGRYVITITDPKDGGYLNAGNDKDLNLDGVQYDVKATTNAPDGTPCVLSVKQSAIAVYNASVTNGEITFADVTFGEGSSQIWVSCDDGSKNGTSSKFTIYADTGIPSVSFVEPLDGRIFNLSDEDKFPGVGFGIDITVQGGSGSESLEDDSVVTLTVIRALSTDTYTGKVRNNTYIFKGIKVTDVAGSDWTETTLRVKGVDRAGNESAEVPIKIYIDRKAPEVNITFPTSDKLGIANDYDYGTPELQTQIKVDVKNGKAGSDVNLTVSGATSINSSLALTADSQILTFPNTTTYFTLNNGSNVVTATTRDAAGNTGSAIRTYDVNTDRPILEIFDKNFTKLNDTTNYVWNKSYDQSQSQPGFQGYFFVQTKGLKKDSEVRLCSDNYGSATELCQDGSGLFRVIARGNVIVSGDVGNVPFGQVNMAEGDHRVFAEAQDDYGNKGYSVTSRIRVDSVPPTVNAVVISNNKLENDVAPNIMLGLSEDADTGTSGIQSTFAITTSGAEDGQKVYLIDNGIKVNGVEGTITNNSATLSYNIPDGTHTYSIEVSDAAGNKNEISPSIALLADSIPPIVSFNSPPEFVNPNWLTQQNCIYNCIYEGSTLKLDVVVNISDNNPLTGQKVSLTRGAIKTEITIDNTMGNQVTFQSYSLLQGVNTVKADLFDIVKNPAQQVSREFDVDTVAPTVAFVFPNTPNQSNPYIFLPSDDKDGDLNNGLQTDKFEISITNVDSPSTVTIENRLVGIGQFNDVPDAQAVVDSDNSNFQFNFVPYPTLYKGNREFRIKVVDDKGNVAYSSKIYANVNINVPAVGIEKWTADGVVNTDDELVNNSKFTAADDFDPAPNSFKTTINVVSDVMSGASARLWVNGVEIVPAVQLQGGKAAFTNIVLNQYPATNTLKAQVTDPNSGITTTVELFNILADGDKPTVAFTKPAPDGNNLSIDRVYTSVDDNDPIASGLQFKPADAITIQTTGVEQNQVALLNCTGEANIGGDNRAIVMADGTATFSNVIFYTAHTPYDCTVEVYDYVGNRADDPQHIQIYVDVLPPASIIPSVCIGETTDNTKDEEKEPAQCTTLCQPNKEYCGLEGTTFEPDKTRCECSRRMGIAKLFWTAPANDGNNASSGKVANYEIRWAEDTSASHNCLGFAWSTASGDGVEIGQIVDPGQTQTAIVRGLVIHKYYCFAVKAKDSVPSPGTPNESTTSGYEKDRRVPFIIKNIATGETSTYGSNISILGDFDGDGRADPVVSDSAYSTNRGKVYVYYADNLRSPLIISGGSNNAYFGSSINIGDFNGDGYDDLLIGSFGAYGNDGRAYIYLGSANGLPTTT
ncbi:MAG: FG-GAP-like repeat-containing protein, partial [Myxococcota bacterium]